MAFSKRKRDEAASTKRDKPKKRFRKQKRYHSSSEESEEDEQGFASVNLADSDEDSAPKTKTKSQPKLRKTVKVQDESVVADQSSTTSEEDDADDVENLDDITDDEDNFEQEMGTGANRRPVSKRNNPDAFSTSISKILSTKLSQSARKDPVLSRSKDAAATTTAISNERLENRARAKLRAEKKEGLEKGRVKDVLGVSRGEAGKVAEEEKRLRKIAQRGVVKLFNAVYAAQVRAEQAAREEKRKGTIGAANREEKINEMSKQGFMELINGKKATAIEEA